MKTNWKIVGAVVVPLLFMVFMVLLVLTTNHIERRYQENTPPEVKVGHFAVREELRTVTRGDFVEMENGRLYVVVSNYNPGSDVTSIDVIQLHTTVVRISVSAMYRRTARVVKKDDPNWTVTAKKFLG